LNRESVALAADWIGASLQRSVVRNDENGMPIKFKLNEPAAKLVRDVISGSPRAA
jgi:hypothetical protein